MADTPKWTSKAADDFLKALGAVPAKPKPVMAPKPVTQAEKVMATVKNPGKAPAPAMGSFSSMNVPTSELKKAQAKPKATPWEERQDSVRRLSIKHQLNTLEDQTLLDSFLYANREAGDGTKISPVESKSTAPAFEVTQKAVNRANSLLRTPEGRAKMAAEVAEFKAQRAMLAAQPKKSVVGPITPAQAKSVQALKDEANNQFTKDEAAAEERWKTKTASGRTYEAVRQAKESALKAASPIADLSFNINPAFWGLPQQVKGAISPLIKSTPLEVLAQIPTSLADAFAGLDPGSGLPAGARSQMIGSAGLAATGGLLGIGATGRAIEAAGKAVKSARTAKELGSALDEVLRLATTGKTIAESTAEKTARAAQKARRAAERSQNAIPQSNAVKLMVKQGPPVPPVEPVIPKPVAPAASAPMPPAPSVVRPSVPTAIYNGKVVPMDYIADPKDQFKRAAQRIVDNGAEGYVVTPQGKVYKVGQSSRKAKLVTGDEAQAALSQAIPKPAQPEVPTTAPVATPKAPKVKPAPVVAEAVTQEAKQSIPESAGKEPWQMTQAEVLSNGRKKESPGSPRYYESMSDYELASALKANPKDGMVVTETLKRANAAGFRSPTQWESAIQKAKDTARATHKSGVEAALAEGKPVPAEVLADYPDLAPKVSTTPPVSTAGKVANVGKPTPADASARATARADKAFRAKHGVGLGDEVTVTYPNGKVQEGVLEHTPKTGWRIKGDAVTEKTFKSIKPKAQSVESVPTPELSPSPIVRQAHEGGQSAPGVKGKHGMTKPQASSLVAQIDEYAKAGGQGRASFDIPKDGTFTIDNLRQASNLRHEFAGEGIQGLPKMVTGAKVTMPEGREWKIKSVSGDNVTLVPPQATPGSKAWSQEYTVDASVFKREAPKVDDISAGRTGKRVQITPWKKDGTREVPVQAERITGNGLEDANLAGRKSGDGYSVYDVATGESVISRPTKAEAIEAVDRLVATKFDGDAKKLAEEIKSRHSGLRGDKAIVSTTPPTPKVEAPIPEVPKPSAFQEDDIVRTADGKLAQVMGMTNDGKVRLLERDEVTGALGKELTAPASSLRKSANTMDDIRALEADIRLPGGKFEDVRKQLGTPELKKLNPDTEVPKPVGTGGTKPFSIGFKKGAKGHAGSRKHAVATGTFETPAARDAYTLGSKQRLNEYSTPGKSASEVASSKVDAMQSAARSISSETGIPAEILIDGYTKRGTNSDLWKMADEVYKKANAEAKAIGDGGVFSVRLPADAAPPTPKPTTGMEGLADRLAHRKAALQEKLNKAPKAIKGKQAGMTFNVETVVDQIDYFLTSAAEAAMRKGISLRKSIQELVMAEGRDADDVAAINKALPKWADEMGLDDAFINGAKGTGKTADDLVTLADVGTDAARLARKELPTSAPAASAERLAAKGVPEYKADTAGTARMVQNAVAEGRVMDENEVAKAAAYYVDLNNQQAAAYAKLNKAGLSEAERDAVLVELNSIESEMGVAEEAAQLVKTKFHNLGEALQVLLTPKYDFVSMKNKALRANLGQNLSDIQTTVIRDQAQSIGELEGSVSELKTKLRKRTAKAVASLDPQVKDAEAAWAKAFTEHENQKAALKQIQKETRGSTRQARNLESRVQRAKAKLDAAQSRLDEAQTAADAIPEAPRAARTAKTAAPVTGKVMRQRGASILQRLGLYKAGADVPEFVSGGMRSKRSGAVNLPGSEKDQEAMARGIRMMIRGFVEDAANAGLPPLTTGEAVDLLKADPNFMLDEDQVYALLSGQFRTVKLEANVQKMAADRLLTAFREDAKYKAMPKFLKGAMILKDAALTLPRATVFSGDLSAMLNQGGKALMYGYAKEWGQSLAPMMKAIKGGEKEFLRQFADIQSSPIYPRAVKAGIDMTEAGSLTKAEEVFASGLMDTWAKLGERSNPILKTLSIPAQVVKRSEYAYTTFLNSLRMKMFEKLAKLNPDDPQYLKDMAGFVNVVTGRGMVSPKYRGAAQAASHVLIAPRFYLSQAQDLVWMPLWKALASKDAVGAKVAAKYYASKALAYGMVAAFAKTAGWELDTDPRSNGFGRISHKGMGVDVNLFGQDLQWIRPMVQSIYGQVSLGKSYRSPYEPGMTGFGPESALIERKLVPTMKIINDLRRQEQYNFKTGKNEPISPGGVAGAFLPISVRDAADAIAAKDPAFKSAAKIILNMLGLQVNELKASSGEKIPPLDWKNPPKRAPKKAKPSSSPFSPTSTPSYFKTKNPFKSSQ